METLVEFTREYGLTAGIQKAVRDADKIESLEKVEARGSILRQNGCGALAQAFENRAKYLRASGVR